MAITSLKVNTFEISKMLLGKRHFHLKHEIEQRQMCIDDLNDRLKETLEGQAKLIKEAEAILNEMNNLPESEK